MRSRCSIEDSRLGCRFWRPAAGVYRRLRLKLDRLVNQHPPLSVSQGSRTGVHVSLHAKKASNQVLPPYSESSGTSSKWFLWNASYRVCCCIELTVGSATGLFVFNSKKSIRIMPSRTLPNTSETKPAPWPWAAPWTASWTVPWVVL